MIGSCDYCGEYCAGLGVNAVEFYELDSGWIPPSARDRHVGLVMARLECAVAEGGYFYPSHIGPYHDSRGRALWACPNCSSRSSMSTGDWDTDLDHSHCPTCWGRVAGAMVLQRKRVPGATTAAIPVAGEPSDPTAPADRARAEAALRAYVGDRLPKVRWVASPLEVVRALAAAIEASPIELDPEPVSRVAPWSIRARERDFVSVFENDDGDPEPADDPRRRSNTAIANALAAAIRTTEAAAAGRLVNLLPVVLADAGQFSSPRSTDDPDLARLLDELRESAGPLVVLNREIVISERPIRCSIDDLGRPHAEGGPAIAYGDGLAVFAWHGVVVPEWAVGDPDGISIEAFDAERNVEVRRVLVERIGIERLVRDQGAGLVHEDETGRLWRRDLPMGDPSTGGRGRPVDEPITIVEVINATPEPDGSRRTYFLRVPPSIATAREAVAWTFSMSPDAYRPSIES